MTDLKAIQARSLEMAEYFVAFCKEHDLLCYLCGGGAIGALRNKGFIPWDDDLDFFMPFFIFYIMIISFFIQLYFITPYGQIRGLLL